MAREVLTDKIWEQLEAQLPKLRGSKRRGARQFLEAVCWIVRTGAPWRDMPLEFGSWKTVYNRYNRWVKRGYLDKILAFFKKDGDHEWHMVDATYIRAHRHAAGARGGQDNYKERNAVKRLFARLKEFRRIAT